jgi:hypothetical protein
VLFFYGYLRRQDDTAVLATMKSIFAAATFAVAFIDLAFVSLILCFAYRMRSISGT